MTVDGVRVLRWAWILVTLAALGILIGLYVSGGGAP